MPDTIQATLTFDESSQLNAYRYHMWHRYRFWLMLRTLLSIGLVLTGFILLMVHGPNPMPLLMLMVGTFALVRPMIWKIMHSRNLRKLPGYGQKVTYGFTEDSILINGESHKAEVHWNKLFEVRITSKGILFYHSKKAYTWVPSSAFKTTIDYHKVSDWAKNN